MDKWTELRTAYQVARLGTVSAASEALGLHRATINRHVDVLEAELGARIFIRHAKGYTLTDFGDEVLKVAEKTDDMLAELAGRAIAAGEALDGEITLTVLPALAHLIYKPLHVFRTEHPNCQVNVLATESLTRLEYGEAQIALRAGAKPDHPDYIVQDYCELNVGLFAHQSYIDRHGSPTSIEALNQHMFVAPPKDRARIPFIKWFYDTISPDRIAVISSNTDITENLIATGLGIGLMMDFDDLKDRGIVNVLPDDLQWPTAVSLVTHMDLHRTRKVQEMARILKDHAPVG